MKPWIDTFNEKYIPEPMSGCWLWIGAVDRKGYGQMNRENIGHKIAHRFSWEYYIGPIPDGLFVCHKCDIPSCVNPDHLFLGTAKQNTEDSIRKGRMFTKKRWDNRPMGNKHGMSKLSEDDIPEIRRDSRPLREIGSDYGVSGTTIFRIKKRETWGYI